MQLCTPQLEPTELLVRCGVARKKSFALLHFHRGAAEVTDKEMSTIYGNRMELVGTAELGLFRRIRVLLPIETRKKASEQLHNRALPPKVESAEENAAVLDGGTG